jgi:hypothetical protein
VNEAALARILVEEIPLKTHAADKKVGVLATRMLLQVQSVPSLLAHLADFALVQDKADKGKAKIQLDFLQLPREIVPDLERLLSVDYFKNHRLVQYVRNGQARTGVEVSVSADDLPGSEIDYSY